jgi:hypothetical protein
MGFGPNAKIVTGLVLMVPAIYLMNKGCQNYRLNQAEIAKAALEQTIKEVKKTDELSAKIEVTAVVEESSNNKEDASFIKKVKNYFSSKE